MDLSKDTTNNDNNPDFNSNIYCNTYGQMSDLFSSPVIPKMVVVGLNEEFVDSVAEREKLKMFKAILVKSLDNLFIVEFQEQFVPRCEKLPNQMLNYRNHEVKETWMYKIRSEYPSILVDFRLMSVYEMAGMSEGYGDEILIEQISQTRNSISSVDGPVYLVWLSGTGLTNQRITNLSKGSGIDKSTISIIELLSDPQNIATNLKPRIQDCYEFSRQFYQNLSKKYKRSLGAPEKIQKFMQPWMCPVYYYFKLAILDEFKGDFTSALKHYHTILAKFKELIEHGNEGWTLEWKYQMINYLRNYADICFIRLSFLLFRLDQCSEAEFGLFRYFNFFGYGLNTHSETLLWRYNMSRMFARLLGWSIIWSPKNGQLMRGPSNFFIYAVKLAKSYMKTSEDEVYHIQEMVLKDLYDALEYAKMNSKLVYLTKYIEFMIIEETQQHDQMITSKCGWKALDDELLKISTNQYKNQQSYIEAINGELERGITDFNTFEDWCMIVSELGNSKRLSLNNANEVLFCCVGFKRRNCLVFEECEFELSIYTKFPFILESFDICFESQVVKMNYTPSGVFKLKPEKVGKLKIQCVKLHFARPNVTIQIDENHLQHQQNSEQNYRKMSLEFSRKCQGTLKSMLQLRVDPLKPKIKLVIEEINGVILRGSEVEMKLCLRNETELPITCTLDTSHCTALNNSAVTIDLGPVESKDIVMKYKVCNKTIIFTTICKFNLELMDFRYAEICSFDSLNETVKINFQVVDPFKISLLKDRMNVLIEAKEDIEWISMEGNDDAPVIMKSGCSKVFKAKGDGVSGSFRVLKDENKRIFEHKWTFI